MTETAKTALRLALPPLPPGFVAGPVHFHNCFGNRAEHGIMGRFRKIGHYNKRGNFVCHKVERP